MGESCTLSILVPVYQVEKYLRQCMDSLVHQHDDFEIVLVDDGSTDGSGEICDQYAKQYDYVHVLHQENKGHTSARLAGLRQAKGRYIAFVDSDDWVDPDYYRPMLEAMERDDSVDICIGRAVRNFPDGREVEHCEPMPDRRMTHAEAAREMALGCHFRWELWNKIFRKSLFDDFHPDLNQVNGEDLIQAWDLFLRARNVLYMARKGAYHYRYNPESLCHTAKHGGDYYRALEYVMTHMWLDDEEVLEVARHQWLRYQRMHFREMAYLVFIGQEDIGNLENLYSRMHEVLLKLHAETESFFDIFKASCEECLEKYHVAFAHMLVALKHGTQSGRPFFIYGTGLVADYAARMLEQMHGECTGYLVSQGKKKQDVFHGKPVWYATQEIMDDDHVIYLALRDKWEREVRESLSGCRAELISADLTDVF